MSDDHLKNWVQNTLSRDMISGINGIKVFSWRDWLHILNEDPPEQTIKQRRNLLAMSVISWLIWYAGVSVSTFSLLGANIAFRDPKMLYLFALLLHTYFFVTFIVTTFTDYIDKINLRHRSAINLSGWPNRDVAFKELEIVIYKKALDILLSSKCPDFRGSSSVFKEDIISSLDDFLAKFFSEKKLSGNEQANLELEKKTLGKLKRNLHIAWLKLVLIYLVPIIVGGYSLFKLVLLYFFPAP